MFDRRSLLLGVSGTALAALPAWAQDKPQDKVAKAAKVADKLRIVIPANAGGGWDGTGRMLGAALVAAGAAGEVEYENKGGKGGTVGLPYYVDKYGSDENTLFIGGAVMVGAVALHKPAADMSKITPLSKLTSEFTTLLVKAESKFKTAADLVAAWKADPQSVRLVGGSAGGIEHMFTGMLMRAAGTDAKRMNYTPFASGKSDVEGALGSDKADVAVVGLAEAREKIAGGKFRVLGVSSTKPLYGVPTFRDVGLQGSVANWRGVFTGLNVSPARQETLMQAVVAAGRHPSFIAAVKQQNVEYTLVFGKQFASAVDNDVAVAQAMVYLLGLKA